MEDGGIDDNGIGLLWVHCEVVNPMGLSSWIFFGHTAWTFDYAIRILLLCYSHGLLQPSDLKFEG
jgi:hypothetical protein